MSRIIAIIQARVSSVRLAKKVLLTLEGKTVLEQVIDRVKNSKLIQEVIVATTVLKEDLKIVRLCSARGVIVYCGSEKDVLDRYYQAAQLLKAEHIVRITADCPLIDPEIIDEVIRLHLFKKADYTSNTIKETFPDGEDVEIFTIDTLKRVWQDARLPSEREHVTPYIYKNHPKLFKLANLESPDNLCQKRWTLDEKQDYKFITLIYKFLYKRNKIFGMPEILGLLRRHPEYEDINHNIKRNQGYLKSLKEDKILI